jgi:hypothetical protein
MAKKMKKKKKKHYPLLSEDLPDSLSFLHPWSCDVESEENTLNVKSEEGVKCSVRSMNYNNQHQ